MTSYLTLIETMRISCAVFTARPYAERVYAVVVCLCVCLCVCGSVCHTPVLYQKGYT